MSSDELKKTKLVLSDKVASGKWLVANEKWLQKSIYRDVGDSYWRRH